MARDIDLELVAQARGWTYEQALADRLAADAVGEAAERLAKTRPDAFVGSIVADEPGAPPILLVKGVADESIRGMVAEVAKAKDVTINVQDEQPFSFDELEERQLRVHAALTAAGYDEVVISSGVRNSGKSIPAVVRRKQGLAASAAEILAQVPQDLRGATDLQVVDYEIVREQHVYGGMNARDDGVSLCTLGWVIGNLEGAPVWGITTAGHCPTGINQALFYPEQYGDYEDLDFQALHIGTWGDIGWHAPVFIPRYEFRAGPSDWRDTLQVESVAGLSVGEAVCQYAPTPQQNVRDCSADVYDTSMTCGPAQRLVVMDVNITEGGDSGSGWSYNNRAYGSHWGLCNTGGTYRSGYSNADRFDEALDIVVATQ